MPDLRPSRPLSSGPTLFLAPSPIAWQARHLLNDDLPAAASCASAADAAADLETAEAALAAGDVNAAAQAFAEILQKDAENERAVAGLAKCYIKTGDLTRAEQTLALVPPAKADSAPVASALASVELARKASSAGDVETLRAKTEANPNDTQSRFDLALALNARGDRKGALEELLTIMRKDRTFNDDAARKQLLQLFDAWGGSDPITISGRQRLSSLLFA